MFMVSRGGDFLPAPAVKAHSGPKCRYFWNLYALEGAAEFSASPPPAPWRMIPSVPDADDFHHSVYVILLDPAVLRHSSILRLNPNRDPAKPAIYVGMTGLPVDHRFENHKAGYKSSWVAEKYGLRLLPELYEHLNPMPFAAAAQMEIELAEELRDEGYTVTGGH